MANVIQSLMVMIGGDTGGLEGALGTADKTLKEFGISFHGIIEGLSFSALIVGAVEAGEVFEKASIQMQRATGATGVALEGMEENFKHLYAASAQSGEVIAGALAQIAQKTGATGEALEGLAKSELQFAKVTGGDVKTTVDATQKLFQQWQITTEQQSIALDVLYVAMQQSGITADKLNASMLAMGPVLRNLGFNFEGSAALIASFEKAGLDATDMAMGLNKAFGAFAKARKDPMEALMGLVEQMGHAETRTQALVLAMDAGFNAKTAGKFVDAVMSGAFSLKELIAKLDASTGAVAKMSANTKTLGSEWTKLGHAFGTMIEGPGVSVLHWLTEALSGFNELSAKIGMLRAIFAGGWGAAKLLEDAGSRTEHSLTKEREARENTPDSIGTPGSDGGGGTSSKGLAEQYAQRKAVIDGELAHQKAVFEAEKIGYDELEKQKLISAEDYANKVKGLLERELAMEVAAIDKKLALEKKAKTEGAVDQVLMNQRQAAIDKEGNEELKLNAKMNEAKTADDKRELEEWSKIQDQRQAYAVKVAEFAQQYEEALALDAIKTDGLKVAAMMQHDTNLLEQKRTRAAIEEQLGIISAKTRISIDLDVDKQEEAIQKTAIQREIDLLDTADASYLSRKQALENKLLQMADQRAAKEQANQLKQEQGYSAEIKSLERIIQRKQEEGKATQSEIIQLTNMQMRQQALNTLSAGLGPIYKGLAQNFNQAFNAIGAGLVAGITGTKTWGQAWRDTLKSIETAILTTLINAILKMAAAWIINLVLGKATASAVDVGEVAGEAAVAGAAAAASTAAIPIIGPALAIPAGLAMYASVLGTFGPLALFERGGRVPADMLAMVHKGEYFLPAHETAMAAAGGGGITVNFYGDFSGVTQDLVNTVMNKAIGAARRAGAKL